MLYMIYMPFMVSNAYIHCYLIVIFDSLVKDSSLQASDDGDDANQLSGN